MVSNSAMIENNSFVAAQNDAQLALSGQIQAPESKT